MLVPGEKLMLFVNKLRTFFPALRTLRPLIDTCQKCLTSPASLANGGFQNQGVCLQAFPSFPYPTVSFLFFLSPHFSRGQNAESLLHGNACYAGYRCACVLNYKCQIDNSVRAKFLRRFKFNVRPDNWNRYLK